MTIQIPSIFKDLFTKKARYKIYHGGRGGGKSWSIAEALVILGTQKPLRILCTREIQRTIKESVHKLLSDTINKLKLDNFYKILNNEIYGLNKTMFIFTGLRTNTSEIKSLEGIDIVWCEEAEKIVEDSWNILIPTIRKEGSEIWMSFNPAEEDDATYIRFAINPPPDSIVHKVTFRDNPFFPEVLRKEMAYDKKMNTDKYKHVWEGEPKQRSKLAIYRFNDTVNLIDKELFFNQGIETVTSWDFGVGDDTAIIFYQLVKIPPKEHNPKGLIINIFDEYTNAEQSSEHYRKVVDDKHYLIDRHYCDPSGKNRDADLSSWVDKLSFNNKTGKRDWHFEWRHDLSVAEMVDHANDYLPYVRINRQQCPKTVMMFKKWQWREDKEGRKQIPARPRHDEYSHLGTSFYYMVCNRFPLFKHSKKAVLK